MMPYRSILALSAVFLALLSVSPVFAQTDTGVSINAQTDADVIVEGTDETEPLEGIKIDEVGEPPSAFGLFWRGLGERISLLATIDPVKKAEKQIRFAEERMRIAEKFAEQSSDDPAAQARIDAMIERATEFLSRVEERRDVFVENDDIRTHRLLRNIATHHIRREQVFDRIQDRLPEQALERFEARREQFEEHGKQFLRVLDNEKLPEDVREHLMNVRDRIESKAEAEMEFRTERRELLDAARDGDEGARARLQSLREERQERLEEIRNTFKQRTMEFREGERAAAGDADAGARLDRLESARARVDEQNRRQEFVDSGQAACDRVTQGDAAAGDGQRCEEFRRRNTGNPAVRAIRRVEEIRTRAEDRKDRVEVELREDTSGSGRVGAMRLDVRQETRVDTRDDTDRSGSGDESL